MAGAGADLAAVLSACVEAVESSRPPGADVGVYAVITAERAQVRLEYQRPSHLVRLLRWLGVLHG